MLNIIKVTFIILELLIITWSAAEKSQPYCYVNVTETSYIVVTKTRLKNVTSKNFFKKIILKKDTKIEIYEEQEPVFKIKLKRTCCEGYKLSEYDVCEPQCVKNGCPQHSKCVEPEICECNNGYFPVRSAVDGKHYCEPICAEPCPEHSVCVGPNQCACKKGYHNIQQKCVPYCVSGCPYEGVCIAPNICSCQEGYKSEKGSCLPICSLGDQCQNGRCIAKDHCICNHGFSWNRDELRCEQNDRQSSTYYPDFTEMQLYTDSSLEVETDIETSNDDIDPNQVFDENMETTTFYVTDDEYDVSTLSSLEPKHKCDADYVFHKGQCRPLKFVANDIDCWQKPCQDKHAVCLENGTCACTEGFKLFRNFVANDNGLDQTFEIVCLSPAEYEIKLKHLEQEPQQATFKEQNNWISIFFIVLGLLILLAALIFLATKIFFKQRGEVDTQGKNLTCTYDNRACSELEKSVI